MSERILLVAPSWIGDAILSEPLVALLREPFEEPIVDVLAPPWCAPVYARMRGIGRIIDNPVGHGKVDLATRRRIARALRDERGRPRYGRALVLPNSWKSGLIPWLAGIKHRTGYIGEARWGLLNDARRQRARELPRLVDRYAALAARPGQLVPMPPAPRLVPNAANRAAATLALDLGTPRRLAVLCPGAEYGPAKRWSPEHFAELAERFLASGMEVWLIGSPKDHVAAESVMTAMGEHAHRLRDITGRTDLGTAIDLLSLASVVVSNDSGLMHAAAAVGVPVVALFGSSSPNYTPPLSPHARIARIDIACSPCFQRECPLGHFKCMRELKPAAVYDLARSVAPAPDSMPR